VRACLAAALVLLAVVAACTTGTSGTNRRAAPNPAGAAPVTLTVWHGWTDDREIQAFQASLDAYRRSRPNVTIRAIRAMDDERIIQGIRGGNGPDVAVSFTTDNVGQFCASGAWRDLTPYLASSRIDLAATFPRALREYTSFEGRQCALPLLADTYGLYYNRRLLAAKGFTAPPKTVSELVRMARALAETGPDGSLKRVGFLPSMRFYEHSPAHFAPSWGARWQQPDGRSALSTDPAWRELLTWQRDAVTALGGYERLERFRQGLGAEFSADNPFQTGQVAMAMDGEWRTGFIARDRPDLDYGTAPFPVADDKPHLYGAGYLTGTVIGVPKTARDPGAAWDLVRHLSTDTASLVAFAKAIRNLPSTFAALEASDLDTDPTLRPFLDIFRHPHSATAPASRNGGRYQVEATAFAYAWETGDVPDLEAGLRELDRRIDAANALARP
jgi:multiple sugar transport system substrate-binding protein